MPQDAPNGNYAATRAGRWRSVVLCVPHTSNNPVNYTDPDGHCPRPAGNTGSVICLALFIKPSTIQAGPFTVHGDGRDFQIDSDPGASRGYIWIDVESGTWETHMNPSGYIFQGNLLSFGADSTAYFDPSAFNQWDVSIEDNVITVSYDLVISGPLEWTQSAPHINGTVQFIINEDGSISYAFDRDGFPWAEAYLYSGDETEVIFQDPAVRGNPYDLFGIEPNPGFPAVVAREVQRFSFDAPLTSTLNQRGPQ